jgi:predicted transcriptional regulator
MPHLYMRMGRRFYTEDADNRVLSEIIESGKEGIYQKDLLERIPGIHRSTVNRVADRLEKKGQIRIMRKGKSVRYAAVNDVQIDIGIGAYLLGKHFNLSILGKKRVILYDFTQEDLIIKSIEDGHVNQALKYVDFRSYRQFFEPKFTENSLLEEIIFEFSNQVGAFMTYVLIQAMNEDNIDRLLLLQKKSKREAKDITEREKQNRFITEEWIKNSISSNLIQMLWRFNHILKPFGYIPTNIQTKKGLELKKLGPYLLDEKSISELSKAFANVYPRLFYELEKLRNNLPVNTILHKEYEKNIVEKIKKQSKCKHIFSEPKILATGIDGKSEKIVELCSKCGYKKAYEKKY